MHNLLPSLKFVQGAVARKDFQPELTHFLIRNRSIKSYNGRIALCCPIDLALDVSPKAVPFLKAISACRDVVAMHQTEAGRLSVKSGGFRVLIDCIGTEAFPDVEPTGTVVNIPGNFMDAIRAIAPFIAEDASREWARGILFRGPSAFATNNVIIVEHWLGYQFPVEVNVPKTAVAELLRIDQEPLFLQVDTDSVTFHFPDNRWLRTQTFTSEWPDVHRILDKDSECQPFPENFFEGLETIAPFLDKLERVYLGDFGFKTTLEDGEGAHFVTGPFPTGIFNSVQLLKLRGLVNKIDFSMYPQPCLFYGPNIRGAIVGIRS